MRGGVKKTKNFLGFFCLANFLNLSMFSKIFIINILEKVLEFGSEKKQKLSRVRLSRFRLTVQLQVPELRLEN